MFCSQKVPIHLTYKIFELKTKRIRIINPKRDPKEEKPEEKEWKEVQLQISENGVMSVRNVENSECSPIPAVEAPPVYSPSMISSSSNHYNATPASATENVTLEASRAPEQSTTINSDVNMDTDPVSTEPPPAKVESEIEKMESTNIRPPTPISSSSSADTIPPAVISVAARLTSGEVTVTPSLTSVTPVATAVVTTSSSVSTPSPTQSRPITTSQSLTVTSVASPRPDSVMSPSFSTTAPQGPSMVTTSGLTVSSPTWTESVTITTASLPQTVSSVPLTTVSLASYTVPSLPPPVSIPHVLVGANTIPSSTALETCIVTTMAGMKPQTNLVPSNFPIMSTCRPQTEPIVSVSKVSKDQVRKPNNVIEANKLSISRVPPGGMKEKGENLNKIVNKLSPNERVIGNTSVTIRPVINSSVNSPNPPKMFPITRPPGLQSPPASVSKERQPQMKYKTLKSPTKQWNPSIDRATMLMKQNTDQSKPARFFKMRNMPRFLGNPSSGVKPMYACPEEPSPNQVKQKLTLMKVDPKSIPTSSIPRSPTKQPPPYTPGSPKMSKPPPAYPDPKPTYLNPSRMPSPAHAGNFLPPNPYHLLYNSYPGFSHEANRMISPELIRSMCAYHPSLPPSIGMLFNPNIHPAMPRPQENYKSEPPTPAVQRIPPSKTETPPPKQIEEKRFPSPVGLPEIKKSTPTPPPISSSPKEVEKPPGPPPSPAPATQEANLKSPVPSEPSQSLPAAEEKQNNLDTPHEKNSLEESDVMKINCDAINVNNNNSKESPPSQPSEGLTPKP